MNKKMWLYAAVGLAFFMAACQVVISISPAAAAYFQAPPPLLENRTQLFIIGEGAALVLVIFAFYALSGTGSIRKLPLLRLALVLVSTLFLLRGSFFIFTVLSVLGILEAEVLVQGVISDLVFLSAGVTYAVGTALNWKEMKYRR